MALLDAIASNASMVSSFAMPREADVLPRDPSAQSVLRPRLPKGLLEPRVVAYGGEVVIRPRLVAERRKQLDAPPEAGERLVVDLAGERREARVVVVQARVIRELLEATA